MSNYLSGEVTGHGRDSVDAFTEVFVKTDVRGRFYHCLQNAMMEGILILPPCCKQQVWPWIMSKQTVSFISIRRTISAARAKCWLQTVIWNLESGSAGSATVCFKSNSHQHIYRCISLQNTQHIERSTEPSSSPELAHSVITCPMCPSLQGLHYELLKTHEK